MNPSELRTFFGVLEEHYRPKPYVPTPEETFTNDLLSQAHRKRQDFIRTTRRDPKTQAIYLGEREMRMVRNHLERVCARDSMRADPPFPDLMYDGFTLFRVLTETHTHICVE